MATSGSSPRTKLAGFVMAAWKKLTDMLVVAVLSAVLAALVAGFAVVRQRATERLQNISHNEALAIAKEQVGPGIYAAVPFRNKGSKQQFIAVLVKAPADITPFSDTKTGSLTLLVGTRNVYQRIETDILAYDRMWLSELNRSGEDINALSDAQVRSLEQNRFRVLFGTVDVDGNGVKEVFAIERGGAQGGYSITVHLFDSAQRDAAWLLASSGYQSPSFDMVRTSDNLKEKDDHAAWFTAKAAQFNLFQADAAYARAVQDFQRDNGRGFYQGRVTLRMYPGQPPPAGSVGCAVDDEQFSWLSYFKGHVVGHDKSKDAWFIVYIPVDAYGWVRTMVTGKEHLWMVTAEHGVLAYDKQQHELKAMPLTEDGLMSLTKNSNADIAVKGVGVGSEFGDALSCATA